MRKHLLLTSGLLFFVVLLCVVYCLFFIRAEFLQHVSSLIGIQVQNQQQSNTRSSDQNNGSAPSVHNVVQPYDEHSWDAYQKPSAIELAQQLTPLQYYVTQEDGTETPFNNAYAGNHDKGIYVDIVSGEPLFSSEDKYESGTGWPSFVKPLVPENITLRSDTELLSVRTEVRSVHADSHLGHVFDDGPQDRGGKRYCMNSAAMRFIPYEQMQQDGYGYLLSGF